jgi:flagellar biosynthesis/type III secretory pathway M-ring protein FliF/YscJ
MKKVFWYVLLAAGIIVFVFFGVPRIMGWLSEQHAEKLRQEEEWAKKRAEEITKPVKEAVEDRDRMLGDQKRFRHPSQGAKKRTQEYMDKRAEEPEEAAEWE